MIVPDETQAYAEIVGEYPNQKLNLHLPRGDRGEKGDKGDKGDTGDTGASTTLSVLETTTGVDYQYPGPQGPAGPKGDPGGFVGGAALGVTDLDLIVTPGLYKQDNSNNATLVRNYPRDLTGGVMAVYERVAPGASASVIQHYLPAVNSVAGSPVSYTRYSTGNNTAWTPWRTYASSRVDQTAGRVLYQWDDTNNREQVIYGDTGVRDIVVSHGNGTFGALAVRRMGSMVHLWCTNWTAPVNGASPLTTLLPTGWRNTNTLHSVAGNGSAFHYLTLSANFSGLTIGGTVANGVYSFTMSYSTLDPWPTTLPGVASGSIPNA